MNSSEKLDESAAVVDARFYFGCYTPDRGCGGTDGDVFLKLIGQNVEYPAPGRWYVLNNSGDDRERGDWDSYWIESGSMNTVHTCKLYFVPKGNAAAWEIANCSLNKMKKDPIDGRWKVTEFRNRWSYNRCLRTEGWYPSIDSGFQANEKRKKAVDLLTNDPSLFDAISSTLLLSDQQDIMRLSDNRPVIVEMPSVAARTIESQNEGQ